MPQQPIKSNVWFQGIPKPSPNTILHTTILITLSPPYHCSLSCHSLFLSTSIYTIIKSPHLLFCTLSTPYFHLPVLPLPRLSSPAAPLPPNTMLLPLPPSPGASHPCIPSYVRAWIACTKVTQPQAHGEHTIECSATNYKCGQNC